MKSLLFPVMPVSGFYLMKFEKISSKLGISSVSHLLIPLMILSWIWRILSREIWYRSPSCWRVKGFSAMIRLSKISSSFPESPSLYSFNFFNRSSRFCFSESCSNSPAFVARYEILWVFGGIFFVVNCQNVFNNFSIDWWHINATYKYRLVSSIDFAVRRSYSEISIQYLTFLSIKENQIRLV